MSEIESRIRESLELAVKLASRRAERCAEDIAKLEKDLAYKKFTLESLKVAPDRAANFAVQMRGQYQCPRCWVEDEASVPLRPIPAANSQQDLLKCGFCGYEITLY